MNVIEIIGSARESLADRWADAIMGSYPGEGARFLRREKDRFANPVGSSLRRNARAVIDGICDGMNLEAICASLEEIVKMRAVQNFTPSQAVAFVFSLKDAAREEIAAIGRSGDVNAEALSEYDRNVDQVALLAFDIYVKSQERIYQLRINEIKRSVSSLVRRVNKMGGGDDPELEELMEGKNPRLAEGCEN